MNPDHSEASVLPEVQPASPRTSKLTPDLLHVLKESLFHQPWPRWANKAAARVLNLLFLPGTPTAPLMRLLEARDMAGFLDYVTSDGRIWGRIARFHSETVHNACPGLGGLETAGLPNLGDTLKLCLAEAIAQPPSIQQKYWKSFAQAYAHPITRRKQDSKALRIYLAFVIFWPLIQRCKTLGEVRTLVFSLIPKEPCPPDEDPIDFEDRQIKWFDTLCGRNLGLSLAPRGRPARRKKIPQSP